MDYISCSHWGMMAVSDGQSPITLGEENGMTKTNFTSAEKWAEKFPYYDAHEISYPSGFLPYCRMGHERTIELIREIQKEAQSATSDIEDARTDLAYAHGYISGWNNGIKGNGKPPAEAMKNRIWPAHKILFGDRHD